MELYTGGFAQGKLTYVTKQAGRQDLPVIDGAKESLFEKKWEDGQCVIVNHLHLWVKRQLTEKKDPAKELFLFLESHPATILICDEIGCGIVPVEKEERLYREYVGRLVIQLAEKAERVERIVCGLGICLKNTEQSN